MPVLWLFVAPSLYPSLKATGCGEKAGYRVLQESFQASSRSPLEMGPYPASPHPEAFKGR